MIDQNKKALSFLSNFKKDEKGTISIMFSVSLLTVIVSASAVFDIQQLQSQLQKSQIIADNVGLTASIYIKQNGTPPTSDEQGYVPGKVYSGKDMGFDDGSSGDGDNTSFTVTYDEENGEVIVDISGQVKTMFMSLVGKDYLGFNSQSVVQYAKEENADPASIFLVLDNSGSMGWMDRRSTGYERKRDGRRWRWALVSPPGTRTRISGLISEVKGFNEYLSEQVGEKTDGKANEFLRMGLSAYSSGLITNRTVVPRWGTIPPGNLNSMRASGGTVPHDALRQSENWFRQEDDIHEAVNGSESPLKYVIFMTDGVNSSTSTTNQSIDSCNRMKSQGVIVYTIGYALEPGDYAADADGYSYYRQSQSGSDKAYDFLETCASSASTFIKAEDTTALKEAFDKIGKEIIQDVVRISS